MARIAKNIVTQGLQGKVGNLIFRKRGKKTTAYVLSPRRGPLSKKQKEVQLKFSAAVRQARQALGNATERENFVKMAAKKGKESAYSAAVSYFMLRE